jgi:hypothetical protein
MWRAGDRVAGDRKAANPVQRRGKGQDRDEGNAQASGDQGAGGGEVAGAKLDVGDESGVVAGVHRGPRADGLGFCRDPRLVGEVAQRHRGALRQDVPSGEHDA